ncbi:type II toxin-antitoxin system Phd/YefM family antitoxin [Spiribacter roseus]|jgi:prevent-host-death family protein|uniref:Antitoxin n=1 Tax=Spiribacter roseus TaxID=1855875 RepID=A0ABV3RUF1_9GAMM|nr:type II toxin-antitoxin system Phd/YefM family antitoxin [Spiribacter roseus]KAF0282322.1 prevent-host-death protein [Spiribacter roseus]KAF0284619.1 prevent-host-death protein [Spiribacter roseus]
MKDWQVQEAKARFADLIRAAGDSPQEITYHGKPIAVVISRDAYDHLTAPRESLVDFMRRSPIYGAEDIELERQDSLPREVDL